jgi:hypothetical protein
MNVSKIADTVLSFNDNVFLYRTLPVSKLDAQVNIKDDDTGRPAFEVMYETPDTTFKRITSILNAIFTQRMQTFMLSRTSVIKLIKEDPNHDLSLSPNEYNHLLKVISQRSYFEVLRPHTKKKAGVYKLIEPELTKELHRLAASEYFEAQEKNVLAFYETSTQKSEEHPTLTSPKEMVARTKARLAVKDSK